MKGRLSIRETEGQRLSRERKLLTIVETLWEGIGRDIVDPVNKILIIVDMKIIVIGVWVIWIPIINYE